MKILIIASYNKQRFAPFIEEQAEALKRAGCSIEWFGVKGKGIKGYISVLPQLKEKIRECKPDIIHAHYGLSGLLANLQRKVPVVTTYHGSDINNKKVRQFSKITMLLSKSNIFVSKATLEIAQPLCMNVRRRSPRNNYILLPCGIDLTDLQLTERHAARTAMHLSHNKRYVLFAGAFDNLVKNAPLAKAAVAELIEEENSVVELLELRGYTREQVTLLMCAADVFLLTSFTEGSPQVIKEAMACGCPIVSVDVGDVCERTEGVEGCFVSKSRESQELAILLGKALSFPGRTSGRDKIIADGLDNEHIAQRIMEIYESVVKKNDK